MCRNLSSGGEGGVNAIDRSHVIFARTHRRVRLSDTAAHTTEQTSSSRADTHGDRSGLNFRRCEEEHSTLCRGFYPRL